MKRLKKTIIIILVAALIVCLIPIPRFYKDGGTGELPALSLCFLQA